MSAPNSRAERLASGMFPSKMLRAPSVPEVGMAAEEGEDAAHAATNAVVDPELAAGLAMNRVRPSDPKSPARPSVQLAPPCASPLHPLETLPLRRVNSRAETLAANEEVTRAVAPAKTSLPFTEFTGASQTMRGVYALLERVAESDATVLITGETGTGKELAARAIHKRSVRRDAPTVTVNCASIPANLLESEFFGHVRGAFTGASRDHTGFFVQAHRGTLFLDEIGDMPLEMQAKLLRSLEARTVRPVGAHHEVPFDVRLVSATHRDLVASCLDGTFREDLYHRINVVEVAMPPLRARGADVLLLAQMFLQQFACQQRKAVRRISSAATARLSAYGWPGNIRELRNCMERAVIFARFDEVTAEDLPDRVRASSAAHSMAAIQSSDLLSLAEVERLHIERVMTAAGGDKTVAAEILGLDRSTLYRKLGRWSREHDAESHSAA